MNIRLAINGIILFLGVFLANFSYAESLAPNMQVENVEDLTTKIIKIALQDDSEKNDSDLLDVDFSNISFEALNESEVGQNLSDVKIDISKLTTKERLMLLWAYSKIKLEEHKYIFSASSVSIILVIGLIYWYKHHKKIPVVGN